MKHATVNPTGGASAFRRVALALGLIGALCAIFTLSAAGAKAEEVGFKFDRGVINLGGEEEGLWANLIDPNLDPPDNPATINAEVAEDGTLTAPADEFYFPPKRIEDLETNTPALPVVDANIAITAEDALSGTLDVESGDATIVLPADVLINVYSAGSPISVAKCRIDGFDLTMTTTGSMSDPGDPSADPPREAADYDAAPFAPPSEEGAVIAPWEGLPASQIEGGSLATAVCPKLDEMLGGPGGIWMSGATGEVNPDLPPSMAPKLTGTPATSTESTTAEFAFDVGEGEASPITGFVCSLDGGAAAPCDSGSQSYSGLAVGNHTFEVKSRNDAGEGPATSYAWTITKAPETCPPGTTGTPPNCVKQPTGTARLANLKVQPKAKVVKRGKQAVIKVRVRNTGDAAAKGVRVCVKAPKRLVKVKKCVTLGQIGAGKTKTAKFKVKAKRKRGKAVLKFTASSNNAGKKTGKATVRIK